ncbi:MAG: response regulator transcription factor [Actinobacteria bacterium]|nr:response regulator transcription factor [Actinomycetota bacterium]
MFNLYENRLEKEGYEVISVSDGEEALNLFKKEQPDLIILDLMLPKLSGEEVCRILRKESLVPIIMLTAKDSEVDKVVGLEIGADDYITKPFSLRELLARVKSILRRTESQKTPEKEAEPIRRGPFLLDLKRHEAKLEQKVLALPLKEFAILELFLRNPGRVFTRDLILRKVWGEDYFGDTKTVDVHIRRLREKIEKNASNPQFVQTVRGLGYRFEIDEK